MIDPSRGVNANFYLCMQRDGELELVAKKIVDGRAMYRCKWGAKDQEAEFRYTWEVRSPRGRLRDRARGARHARPDPLVPTPSRTGDRRTCEPQPEEDLIEYSSQLLADYNNPRRLDPRQNFYLKETC